jgi:hypothetical protein
MFAIIWPGTGVLGFVLLLSFLEELKDRITPHVSFFQQVAKER